MNPAPFLTSAEKHLPGSLDLLRQLVAINSFTANAAGVNAVAKLTAEAFAPLGFKAELVPCATPGTGHHLFLSRSGEGVPVILVTHSDTVFPPEEERQNHFHWDERPEEGRIYGPGTIDNKGGTALIWLMLHVIREAAPDFFNRTSWLIASNAAEEITGDGCRDLHPLHCAAMQRTIFVF